MTVKIPANVWELDLPTNEKLVLLAVAHHLNQSGIDSLPDQDWLESRTGYSKRTLRRLLRSLETKEFIRHEEAR